MVTFPENFSIVFHLWETGVSIPEFGEMSHTTWIKKQMALYSMKLSASRTILIPRLPIKVSSKTTRCSDEPRRIIWAIANLYGGEESFCI